MPYAQRRARAIAGFPDGVAIVPGAHLVTRNNDSDFEFRQNSDFFYLTGFDEPDAVLVLSQGENGARSTLFLHRRDRTQEIWNGKRLGVEAAAERLGVDAAFAIDELDERLPALLAGAKTLHYDQGLDENMDRRVQRALGAAREAVRRKGFAPRAIVDASLVLHGLRARKSDDEIATMRRAAEITRRGHVAAMRATRPGVFEYEIEAVLEYEYKRAGAQSTAYDSIVAGGDNALVLHYNTNRERLEAGTLLLVDSACELDLYATDVTRTWPVDGRFSPEQRAIYEIVHAAQRAACACVAPGRKQREFHEAAVRTIVEGLIDVGLLHGTLDENIEKETYRDFYPHGTGHWIGLDVHDVGAYRNERDEPVTLEPGMATTVEPGIYVQRDLDCDERFKGIGVRIEDDLVVTATGHENLTDSIPKAIDEIEAIVGTAELVHA
ncbi:MAG: aminopeptidase P N-terminal domain-containing protein [Vulcanimicrobiaceae bacterium]